MHSLTSVYKCYLVLFLFLCHFLNSCGCSTSKSMTPQETFFHPLNCTKYGSHPSLTTRDKELVSVLELRDEPGDLNPRPLTPQSVTLPTLPWTSYLFLFGYLYFSLHEYWTVSVIAINYQYIYCSLVILLSLFLIKHIYILLKIMTVLALI